MVDAHYLSPTIPAETAPPFGVGSGVRVVPVNDLATLDEAPSQYVVVGSGKTATDACIWLLARGVDPDAICWVRPRDPWMLNRAVIQPDPAVFLGMLADLMESARHARSLDELFLRLEALDVMLRIDPSVTPTMAKAPTLAEWELDQLRTIEDVVRRGHIQDVTRGRLTFAQGSVRVAQDAVVVHCAADGLRIPGTVPVWRPEAITLQTIRAGFPSFGAAVTGYVEATRDDDAEKNRICPPSQYGNTPAGLGADDHPGHPERSVLLRRGRHPRVVDGGRPQPGAHSPRPVGSNRRDRGPGTPGDPHRAGSGPLVELM